MSFERVAPGNPWRPLKASDHNALVKAGEHFTQRLELSQGGPTQTTTINTDIVTVKNSTDNDVAQGQLLQLGARTLDNDQIDNAHIFLDGIAPSPADFIAGRTHGLTRHAIKKGEYGQVQIAGVCLAEVQPLYRDERDVWAQLGPTNTNDWLYPPTPVDPATTFHSLYAYTHRGPITFAQIIELPTSTLRQTTALMAVRILPPHQLPPIYPAKTTEAITHATSGEVEIWRINLDGNPGPTGQYVTASLTWIHNNEDISSGKRVWIALITTEHSQRWEIIGKECE